MYDFEFTFDIREFKYRLKHARLEMCLTQKELSILTGIPKATISYYENFSQTGLPNIDTLDRLITVLDVSYDYLVGKQKER